MKFKPDYQVSFLQPVIQSLPSTQILEKGSPKYCTYVSCLLVCAIEFNK